ncbi:MAG: hypothetical protein ACLFSW_06540 [Halobacteriales archaeon]
MSFDKSNAMGVVLILFGAALALTAGSSGDTTAVVLGFIGAVALFYMGIGLYSRGNTDEDTLHETEEATKRSTLYRTSSYVAGVTAIVALAGFVSATASEESLVVRAVFGVVFLYTLPISLRLWRRSSEVEADEPDESATADEAA